MADNYLEKRMEDYRAGKLAPKPSRLHVTAARKPGDVLLSFPSLRVLVLTSDVLLAEDVCRMFRSADCRVAFCIADTRDGTRIAQATGSRYYPFDPVDADTPAKIIKDMEKRWEGLDVVIDMRGISAADLGDSVAEVAKLLLIHSHPDFSFVTFTDFSV